MNDSEDLAKVTPRLVALAPCLVAEMRQRRERVIDLARQTRAAPRRHLGHMAPQRIGAPVDHVSRLVALAHRIHEQTFKRLDVRGSASELVAKLVSLFHNLHRKH
jgi:hypothetical protein